MGWLCAVSAQCSQQPCQCLALLVMRWCRSLIEGCELYLCGAIVLWRVLLLSTGEPTIRRLNGGVLAGLLRDPISLFASRVDGEQMRANWAATVMVLLLLVAPSSGFGSVRVQADVQSQEIWPNLRVVEDPTEGLGPTQISALPQSAWRTLDHPHTHFGTGHSAYWAYFTLDVNTARASEWYLVHAQSFVDDVRLYLREEGGVWQRMPGVREQAAGWFGGARNPAFPLRLQTGKRYEALVRTQTFSLRRFPLELYSEAAFHRQERSRYFLIGGVMAIPMVVSVFMLLLWQIQRDRGLLIILALILFELVGAMYVGGVLSVMLPWVTPRILGLLGLGGWVGAISLAHVHARYFLQLDRDAPGLARVFRWAPWFILSCLLMEIAGWPGGRNVLILIAFSSSLAFFSASIWQGRRGLPYAWVYAAAWGTYLLSTLVIVVNLLATIPPNVSNLSLYAQGSVVSLIFAVAVVGQMRDRERRTQTELAISNRRFELAAAGAAVGLFDWDRRARRLFLSARAADLLGAVAGNLRGRAFLRSLPRPARRPLLVWQRRLIAARGHSRLLELDLHGRPLLLSGSAVLDESGVARITGSVSDASQLRELEESRSQNRLLEEFRLMFDNASVGLYRADSAGHVLRANALVGQWKQADKVAWHIAPHTWSDMLERLRQQGEVTGYEYDARVCGDETARRFSENARLDFVDADGRMVYEGAVQDITERYRIEQQLVAANARVQIAMADRSRFFAATNHDLRQPLQSLGLLLELMRGQSMPAQMQDWVNRMSLAYASLADTLDGLMELARMEAGRVDVHPEVIALQPLLEQLASEYGLLAERKNLVLSASGTTLHVRSDRRLVERILRNLLSNAVRHTRSGRLLLGCRRRGDRVGIQVLDTGPGIPAAERERLFRPFAQGEVRAGEGLGLGLSIVQGLVQALGHELRVSSIVGGGSCFELQLPRVAAVVETVVARIDAHPTAPLEGHVIWVVDDQEEVARAVSDLLRDAGARVAVATHVAAALSLADPQPDALLLDYHLGRGRTGIEVSRALGARFGHTIPTIYMSGDPEGIPAQNVQGVMVLRKPVTAMRLINAMCQVLREEQGTCATEEGK